MSVIDVTMERMTSNGYKHTEEAREKIRIAGLGRVPWNKGKKMPEDFGEKIREYNKRMGVVPPSPLGKKQTKSHTEAIRKSKVGKKRPDMTGENNWLWKGDEVGLAALHAWVQRKLGTPSKCEHCGSCSKDWYHWSNISGQYLRDISDWQRLCVPCHSKFDRNRL